MAVTLGTNIPSYTARVNLNSTLDKLTKTMERLSTGLKINGAGDDAAGLVISENMEAVIRGSKQARDNIQTATSFLTVAEDGMVSIGDHFQRINDLLVNMANDTNDINSRTAAVREIIERIEEIDRLAETTNFNGKTMLTNNEDPIIVQIGSDSDKNSILDISRALTDCHVESLDAPLPGNLNPEALEVTETVTADDGSTSDVTRVLIPIYNETDKKMEYFYEDTMYKDTEPVKYAGTDIDDLKSAYAPNNENCRAYITKVQGAISELSTRRGLLGAYENRMQSSYDSMATRIESLEAAKSVYTDTDIAEEATNLSSYQIMQQVSAAILTTANSTPQLALSLLGG